MPNAEVTKVEATGALPAVPVVEVVAAAAALTSVRLLTPVTVRAAPSELPVMVSLLVVVL